MSGIKQWTGYGHVALVYPDGELELQTLGAGTALGVSAATELVEWLAGHYLPAGTVSASDSRPITSNPPSVNVQGDAVTGTQSPFAGSQELADAVGQGIEVLAEGMRVPGQAEIVQQAAPKRRGRPRKVNPDASA